MSFLIFLHQLQLPDFSILPCPWKLLRRFTIYSLFLELSESYIFRSRLFRGFRLLSGDFATRGKAPGGHCFFYSWASDILFSLSSVLSVHRFFRFSIPQSIFRSAFTDRPKCTIQISIRTKMFTDRLTGLIPRTTLILLSTDRPTGLMIMVSRLIPKTMLNRSIPKTM